MNNFELKSGKNTTETRKQYMEKITWCFLDAHSQGIAYEPNFTHFTLKSNYVIMFCTPEIKLHLPSNRQSTPHPLRGWRLLTLESY